VLVCVVWEMEWACVWGGKRVVMKWLGVALFIAKVGGLGGGGED
jgi:hypothetical protein